MPPSQRVADEAPAPICGVLICFMRSMQQISCQPRYASVATERINMKNGFHRRLLAPDAASVGGECGRGARAILVHGQRRQGQGRPQWVTRDGDQEPRRLHLQGQRPRARTQGGIHAATDGTFTNYRVTGVSTFGALVNETFTRSRRQGELEIDFGQGRTIGHGRRAVFAAGRHTGSVFALPSPRWRKSSDGKVPMIPSGTLTCAQGARQAEVAAAARSARCRLLALTGVGFTPDHGMGDH